MSKISYIRPNSGTIVAVANNKSYTIPRDHPNYDAIKDAILKDDVDALERMTNIPKAINEFIGGKVEVRNGIVYYNGQVTHHNIADRILETMREGLPPTGLTNFLANLMDNPSKHAVDELYEFLSHHGLPVTEDGCFLGYKRVKDDYTDNHTGTVDNHIGQVPEIPRNTVDDNWRLDCSSGFHVGSIEYVRNFHANSGHVMIVKVNPKDVVSVPSTECTKLRTCKYEVVGEYDKELPEPLQGSLYTPQGERVQGNGGFGYSSNDEDDWEEDGDEDETITTDQLITLATQKAIDPYRLAFELGVASNELTENPPTIKEIIETASGDLDETEIEDTINRM